MKHNLSAPAAMAKLSEKNLNHSLALSASSGDLAAIIELLGQGADPLFQNSQALCIAAMRGHAECVKLLAPISNAMASESRALVYAATHGHAECVALLIPFCSSKADNSIALLWAGGKDCLECFKLISPISEPLIGLTTVLCEAIDFGHADIVSFMLAQEPLLVGKLDLPAALSAATASGHSELAALISSIAEREALATHLPARALNSPDPLLL